MTVKKFKIKGATEKKADILCKIYFNSSLSDTELKVLAVILDYSTNNSITLTPDIGRQIKNEAAISETSFSTSLFRLEKKGAFTKQSRTITFHPVFSNIHTTEKVIITFESETTQS